MYNLLIFFIFFNSFLFAKFAFKRKKNNIHLYKVSKKRISDLIYSCETFFQQIDIHNYAFFIRKAPSTAVEHRLTIVMHCYNYDTGSIN